MLSKQYLPVLPLAISAFSQTPAGPPPNVPYGTPISPDAAKKIAADAISEARKNNWAMAIAVADTAGYGVFFERMPDTQTGSVEIAIGEAKTAVLFRRPTKSLQDTVAAGGEGLRILRSPRSRPKAGFPSSWMEN